MTAVVLLGLSAVALAALAALFSADYRRTRDAGTDAQIRQLLVAGAADVTAKSKAWTDRPAEPQWEVAVPAPLAADGGRVTCRIVTAEAGKVEVAIKAEYLGRTTPQTLHLARSGDRWELTAASLGNPIR